MIVQCFPSVFLFVLFYLPICYCLTKPTPTSGPFKTSIVSINDCRKPGRPYLKKPPMIFYPFIQNIDGKNLLGGNLTVLSDTKDVKIKVKSFAWHDGKWRQSYSFNNLDCHGALLHFTFAAFKVKYDKKTCVYFKGVYTLNNVDVNQLLHIWMPAMPYERLMWRSESFNKDGMFFCKEYDTITEPAH